MAIIKGKRIFKDCLALCLCISLIVAQTFKLHVHLDHDEHADAWAHPAMIMHDTIQPVHPDAAPSEHAASAVELGSDKLTKKAGHIIAFVAILLLLTLSWRGLPKNYLCGRAHGRSRLPRCYYLFQPPLRAPPTIK